MLYSDEQKILKDLNLSQELIPFLRNIAELEKGDVEAVHEDMIIVKKFMDWHELPSNKHKYLRLVHPISINSWLAIEHWWGGYCELRKKIPNPTYDDVHKRFLRIYGPILKQD